MIQFAFRFLALCGQAQQNLQRKNLIKKEFQQYLQQNELEHMEFEECQNKHYDIEQQFRQYMKQSGKQEIIDKYDILYGKDFNIKDIISMRIKYDLDTEYKIILNRQIIEQYCNRYNRYISYFIQPDNQNNDQKDTIAMWLVKQNYFVLKKWMHDYDIKNKDNKSLKDLMIEQHMPVPQHWENINDMTIFDKAYFGIIPDITGHKPDEQDQDGWTVAMILARNDIDVPKEWWHNPELQNKYKQTVAFIQLQLDKIPDKQWQHDPLIRDNNNHTIEDYLLLKKIDVPDEWETNPNKELTHKDKQIIKQYCKYYWIDISYHINSIFQNNYDRNTIAMWSASQNQQIPKYCRHDPTLINNHGQTVAIIYVKNGVIPPREWMYDINIKNHKGDSIKALLQQKQLPIPYHWKDEEQLTIFDQACFGIIPNIDSHKPEEQNEDGFTIAMILIINRIEVPKQWQHDINIKNKYNQTLFDICLYHKIIPEQWFCNDANYQDKYGDTQAMLLAQQNINIPKYLYHNPQLKDCENHTVEDYLISSSQDVPIAWQTNPNRILIEQNKQIIEQYCRYYNIKTNYNISPIYNINENKNTVAMYLASQKQNIPEQWRRDVLLTNIYGQTVAMIYAQNSMISPKEWEHDPNKQEYSGLTVAMRLASNNIIPPQQWYHNPILKSSERNSSLTTAMYIATNCKQIPDNCWNHNPNIQNNNGKTVAMILAQQGIIPPQQWYHKPELQSKNGWTTSMSIARYCNQIPDKHWNHDPLIKNNYKDTVGLLLAEKGIIPPKQWMHDITLYNKDKQSIYSLLKQHNYIYQNNKFMPNCKTQLLNSTCQICLAEGEQQFVLSSCTHKICINCFQNLVQTKINYQCPVCRNYNWYEKEQN